MGVTRAVPGGAGRSGERAEPVVLDEIDKAVVRELQRDGRISYADLGPLVGLSQAAVRQRVRRLIDSGTVQIVGVTDPTSLGFHVFAMLGIRATGDVSIVARTLADLDAVDYVVVTAGRFDLLVEVVCADNSDLLDLVNGDIRSIPGVESAEIFTYLDLVKQTYTWGTR